MFWAHGSNTARLEQSFREIADQVKVRGRKDPQADVFKLVHDWLREKNGRWLLVVDNADDAGVLSAQAGDSRKLQAENDSSANNNSRGALQLRLERYLPPTRSQSPWSRESRRKDGLSLRLHRAHVLNLTQAVLRLFPALSHPKDGLMPKSIFDVSALSTLNHTTLSIYTTLPSLTSYNWEGQYFLVSGC